MTKAQLRKERLEKHYKICEQLGKLTGSKLSGKKISTELFKLEKLANKGATAYCNGETFLGYDFRGNEMAWNAFVNMIKGKLRPILGTIPKGFFVNGDARGYALKFEANSIPLPMYTDWGSYQILSPEINGERGF